MNYQPSTKKEFRERHRKSGPFRIDVYHNWLGVKDSEQVVWFILEMPYYVKTERIEKALKINLPSFERIKKDILPGWYMVWLSEPTQWGLIKEVVPVAIKTNVSPI